MSDKKKISLPFSIPIFSSFHNTAVAGMIFDNDPNARIQMLNQSDHISCSKKFLSGYSSPELGLPKTWLFSYPNIDIVEVNLKDSFREHREIVRSMLEEGRYVYFGKIDDFYMPGKSWYGVRHMLHDGIICGCDDETDTYSIAAYNEKWVFGLIKMPRDSFGNALEKSLSLGEPTLFGCKALDTPIELDIERILKGLRSYVTSDFTVYPTDRNLNGYASGSVVSDYIAIYIDKLLDGSIPYEKMDWRVLRILWEFRVCMLERIQAVEEDLCFSTASSEKYKEIVYKTNRLRLLYAICHQRRKDNILISIKEELLTEARNEKEIINDLIKKMENKYE